MSQLYIDLDTADDRTLRGAIALCQSMMGSQPRVEVQPEDINQAKSDMVTKMSEAQSLLRETVITCDPTQVPVVVPKEPLDSISDRIAATITEGERLQQEQEQDLNPTVADFPGEVEYDSAGIPWDDRIHSKNKTKIAGGLWRPKKGVDEGYVAQVLAEITPATPPATVEEPEPQGLQWAQLLQRITLKQKTGEFQLMQFFGWLNENGITTGIAGLQHHPELWQKVIDEFGV